MLKYIKFTIILAFLFFNSYSDAQRLLWVESANNRIRVANITPTGIGTASVYGSATGLASPKSLAIDANRNYIFYSENSGEDLIRANYNGTSPFALITTGAMAGYQNIAYSENAGGIYAPEMNGGIEFFEESTGTRIVMDLGGNNDYFGWVTVDDGSEVIYAYDQDFDIIYRTSFSDDGLVEIVVGANSVQAMNFDERTNTLWFIDGSNLLWSCDGNGAGLGSHGAALPGSICTGMQVYSPFGKIYYVMDGTICSVNLDRSGQMNFGIPAAGITDLAVEADLTPPGVSAMSPLDGAVNVILFSNLSMTFDENVKISTTAGTIAETSIRIFKTVGNVPVDTIDRAALNISIVGATATINPTDELMGSTDYYILVGSKVFSDLSGNNYGGISSPTAWNFTTEVDASQFYSIKDGAWDDPTTWSHVGHSGPASGDIPGTGTDEFIGSGHTVTLSGNTYAEWNRTGVTIEAGGTLDAGIFDMDITGDLRVAGSFIIPGTLINDAGDLHIYNTSGSLLIIGQLTINTFGMGSTTLHTDIVVLNGVQILTGTINQNGFSICDASINPPPVSTGFTNKKSTSVTMSWSSGASDAFIVARQGSTVFKPNFGSLYNANPAFGSGDAVGTGNFVVYKGTGNSVNITGLLPNTDYEFDLYSYSTSVGGCYSTRNYQSAVPLTTCAVLAAPLNPVNATYCTGDSKPAINVSSPGSGRSINWYDAAVAGNLVPGDISGGDGRGGVFIPAAASGTFYAEIYDGTSQCTSDTRTAVTLTLNPIVTPGTATGTQTVCVGDDPTVISGGTASGGDGSTYAYQWQSATASTTGPYLDIPSAIGANYDPPAGILVTTHYRRRVTSLTCTSQTGNFVSVTIGSPTNVTGLTNTPGDAQIVLNWTNPASCLDDILIIAKLGAIPAASPTGDGTAYTASAVFASGTAIVPGEFVVYKGTGTSVTVTGLTNSVLYGFKVFTRKGTSWSTGTTTSGTGIPTPPVITFTPSNASTNISVTANLTISFNEPVRNLDNSTIDNSNVVSLLSFKLTNAAGTGVSFVATINGTKDVITIDPAAALLPSQLYYLSIAPVEDSNNNATLTSNITFTTQAGPSITTVAPLSVCVGQNVTITGTNFGTAVPTVSINSVNFPVTAHTATSITIVPSTASTGVVTVTNMDLSISTVSSSTLTISALPTIFSVTGGGAYCVGSNGVAIGLTNSQPGVEYEVYLGASSTGVKATPGGGAFNFPGFFTAAGTYSVKGKNAGICSSNMTGTAIVTINDIPSGTGSIASSTTAICQGESVNLTAKGFQNALTYLWTLPTGLSTTSSTSGNAITVTGDAVPGGLVSVSARNDCGLSSAATLTITVNPLPVVSIGAPPVEEQILNDVLPFTSTVDVAVSSYAWSFGDGGSSTEANTEHAYTSEGQYNVALIVKTTAGCEGNADASISINQFPVLSSAAIKNVITANDDGKNDRLIVDNIDRFPNNTVSVLDRWGVEVHKQDAYNNDWDFKKSGNYLPAGSYICIVKLNDSGTVITRTVTLIRK